MYRLCVVSRVQFNICSLGVATVLDIGIRFARTVSASLHLLCMRGYKVWTLPLAPSLPSHSSSGEHRLLLWPTIRTTVAPPPPHLALFTSFGLRGVLAEILHIKILYFSWERFREKSSRTHRLL